MTREWVHLKLLRCIASMCRQLTKCTRNVRTPAMKFAWRPALFHVKSVSVHPNSGVGSGVRSFFVRTQVLYMRPLVSLNKRSSDYVFADLPKRASEQVCGGKCPSTRGAKERNKCYIKYNISGCCCSILVSLTNLCWMIRNSHCSVTLLKKCCVFNSEKITQHDTHQFHLCI